MDELIAKHLADKRERKATKTTKVRSKYGTTTYPAASVVGVKRQKPQSADGAKRRKTQFADGPPAEMDTTRYRKPRKVPGQTAEEKIEHLLRQAAAGFGQLPSEKSNPFAGVFGRGT